MHEATNDQIASWIAAGTDGNQVGALYDLQFRPDFVVFTPADVRAAVAGAIEATRSRHQLLIATGVLVHQVATPPARRYASRLSAIDSARWPALKAATLKKILAQSRDNDGAQA